LNKKSATSHEITAVPFLTYRQLAEAAGTKGFSEDHLYCLRHLPTHLAAAGRDGDLRTLLLNFNWLQTKLEATDPNALIADYDYLPEDKDLQLVQSAIRLSAHVSCAVTSDGRTIVAGESSGRVHFLRLVDPNGSYSVM
jgi:hypothetical protein